MFPGQNDLFLSSVLLQDILTWFTRKKKSLETHRVPFSIVEFGATGYADVDVSFADLHQRNTVF